LRKISKISPGIDRKMNEISIWINQRQFCSNLLFQRLQNGKSAQLQTIVFLMLAVVQTVLKLHLKPDLGLENQSRINYTIYINV